MLVAAALVVGWPLLLPWSYETRDGAGASYEAAQLDAALRDGQIPVRWLPDLDGGRGLPVFVYASPLAFYAIALVHATGIGVLVATKIVVLVALVLAGFATFAWLKTHVPDPAAAVGAAAYAAAPILAALVHLLGDPAVAAAYALVPLVFLGAARAATRTYGGVASLAIAFAALTLADKTIAVALLPLVAVYAVILRARLRIAAGIAIGALVSVFQWGPAWMERDLVHRAHTALPFDAWAIVKLAVVPAAIAAAGLARGRGRALALPALGAACLLVALAVRPVAPLVLVAVVAAAIAAASAGSGPQHLRALLLALSIVPPLATAAFALARQDALLGFLAAGQAVAAAIAIAAATLDERIAERGPPAIVGLVVALVVPWSAAAPVRSALTGEPVVSTLREHDLAREHVRAAGLTRPGNLVRPVTIAPDTSPPPPSGSSLSEFEVRGGELEVSRFTRTARRIALDADSETGGIIALELHDFPGWELTLEGPPYWKREEIAHGSDRAGRIAVSIPPGRWHLEARWTETPLRRACDEASVAGAGILVVLLALAGLRKPQATIRRSRD